MRDKGYDTISARRRDYVCIRRFQSCRCVDQHEFRGIHIRYRIPNQCPRIIDTRRCRLASRTRQFATNRFVLLDAKSIPEPLFKFVVVGLRHTLMVGGFLEGTEVFCAGLADFVVLEDDVGNEVFPLLDRGTQMLLYPSVECCV